MPDIIEREKIKLAIPDRIVEGYEREFNGWRQQPDAIAVVITKQWYDKLMNGSQVLCNGELWHVWFMSREKNGLGKREHCLLIRRDKWRHPMFR